ncbi:MAG: VWA domain-containing protein [Candidatus Riflebacteria bacterium]|nr:VWA domain-containing protein [Candidatus Riflebacteria bacterium]
MGRKTTELVFILDKSGSMAGQETDTIGGYNSMLTKQREEDGECLVTTVLFDTYYKLIQDRTDIQGVKNMTRRDYSAGGSTALIDAIGITIAKIENAHQNTVEECRPKKVLFVIITDGEENSSREYSANQVRAKIEKKQEEDNWEFIFLGANIDAVKSAERIGIKYDRAINYLQDTEGTMINYSALSDTVSDFRKSGIIDETHFEKIRADYEKRK